MSAVVSMVRGQDCAIALVRAGVDHFVVQVIDRDSRILNRHISETRAFPVAYTGEYQGDRSPIRNFHSAARHDPIFVLPVASLDAALRELELLHESDAA